MQTREEYQRMLERHRLEEGYEYEFAWDKELNPEAYQRVYNPPKRRNYWNKKDILTKSPVLICRRQAFSKSGFVAAVAKGRKGK